MKKKMSILLTVVMLAVTVLPCSSVEVIGQVLATDIRAYINDAEIPAYNIDGKLAIVVSDLNNYGFVTQYNNDLRKSSVTRNNAATTFTSVPSKASGLPIGTRVMDVYRSDITVELDGRPVQAFNVDNRMAIYFSDLQVYGSYSYDNNTRTSSISLLGTPYIPYVPFAPTYEDGSVNNMTDLEISNAYKVSFLSKRQVYHDEDKKEFRFQFALTDEAEIEIATAAFVDIRIVNDVHETVYTATKTIRSSDFETWTRTMTGAKSFLATIYISEAAILPGISGNGTLYFTVHNGDYFQFDELDVAIYDLPKKGITVSLPILPKEVSHYNYQGLLDSSCWVTDISYDTNRDTLYLYFTLEKTYDREGNGKSRSCYVGWKLYDEEGYIVDSGTFGSDAIKVGEKIRGGKEYIFDVNPGTSYRLEILDTE